jgi:hypothetical protein
MEGSVKFRKSSSENDHVKCFSTKNPKEAPDRHEKPLQERIAIR